jgi:hypothetical protein
MKLHVQTSPTDAPAEVIPIACAPDQRTAN